MDSNDVSQCWWDEPLKLNEVDRTLDELISRNERWSAGRIIGFPSTPPHPNAARMHTRYWHFHPNNIGLHTNDKQSEVGFGGTQEAERCVIAMTADLMGARYEEVDGYITTGATEANIVACWMARDYRPDEKIAVICSHLTHYSITKACKILGILQPHEDGTLPHWDYSGMHRIGTDASGHILIAQLKNTMSAIARAGIRNCVVIGNAGTTMLGSVDDIDAMSVCIAEVKKAYPDLYIHFHVDAAFGGFIIPFIPALGHIGFKHSEVSSIAIDAHKTGCAPFGTGIFLARKGMFDRVGTDAPYVPGGDFTLSGSRSGLAAMECYAVMRGIGKNGYAKITRELMKETAHVREKLQDIGVTIFESDINIIGVKDPFPDKLASQGYIVHRDSHFPTNMENPFAPPPASDPPLTTIWNIVVMQHHVNISGYLPPGYLDAFVDALARARNDA